MGNECSSSTEGRPRHQDALSSQTTPEQIAESLKGIARSIHEGSSRMSKVVQVLHQSGAINDLSMAVREASVAARDTAREIRDTARDLKEESLVGDTARAIQETTSSASSTVDTIMALASETLKPCHRVMMTRLPEWTAS